MVAHICQEMESVYTFTYCNNVFPANICFSHAQHTYICLIANNVLANFTFARLNDEFFFYFQIVNILQR